MKVLEAIIEFFYKKRSKKFLSDTTRTQSFVDYKSAQSILILFESDYSEKNPEIRRIIHELRNDGKKVSAWGYINKKEITTAMLPDFRIMNNQDADLTLCPKPNYIEELQNHHFDLMLDLSLQKSTFIQYLALYADANCKVGTHLGKDKIHDFVIDFEQLQQDDELSELTINTTFVYNQMIFYLKKIQTND
jgi:hypothetical protein